MQNSECKIQNEIIASQFSLRGDNLLMKRGRYKISFIILLYAFIAAFSAAWSWYVIITCPSLFKSYDVFLDWIFIVVIETSPNNLPLLLLLIKYVWVSSSPIFTRWPFMFSLLVHFSYFLSKTLINGATSLCKSLTKKCALTPKTILLFKSQSM